MIGKTVGHVLGPRGWLSVRFIAPVGDEIFGEAGNISIVPMGPTAPKPAPHVAELQTFICLMLMPAITLPQYRAMDMGPHSKTLSTAVTTICITYYGGKRYRQHKHIELRLGPRRYIVLLWPDSIAAAPLAHMAHRLYILCLQPECDLSPLFALADPLQYPQYAAAVARAVYVPQRENIQFKRWLPICDYIKCDNITSAPPKHEQAAVQSSLEEREIIFSAPNYEQTFARAALDILSNPEKLQLLMRLVYDRSKEARRLGFMAGLWSLNPDATPGDVWSQIEDAVKRRDHLHLCDLSRYAEEGADKGQFSTAATAALGMVAHMVPIQMILPLLRLTL
jgi:hypothetical protein